MDIRWHLKHAAVRAAVKLLKSTGWYDGYYTGWRQFFDYAEKQGLHILPVHHYTPLPDTQNFQPDQWTRERQLRAVDLQFDASLQWFKSLMPPYRAECEALRKEGNPPQGVYTLDNEAFGRGDADVLYSIIRDKKPGKIIEIGSGYSTLLMCQALRANAQESPSYRCEFVAIEPYPPAYLSPAPAELTRVEAKFVQKIDLAEFASLKAGDILFIDSSHTVKIGSDTVYELLSVLPVLAPGVLIHVHDIFSPHEYPETWMRDSRFFWNEQYMLEAFLSYNKDFEVILPLHAISRKHPELMTELIPSYDPKRHGTGSFWMRRR